MLAKLDIQTCQSISLDQKVLPAHQHLALLFDLIQEKGLNLDYLLCKTGIFQDDLTDLNYKISAKQLSQLIINLSQTGMADELSFLYGQRLFLSFFDPQSHLLTHAPDSLTLLRNLSTHQLVFFPLLKLVIQASETDIYLSFEDPFGVSFGLTQSKRRDYMDWLVESFISGLVSLYQWLSKQAPNWQIQMPWHESKQPYYHLYWQQADKFDAGDYILVKKEPTLEPIDTASPRLYAMANKRAHPIEIGFLSYIREYFRQSLQAPPSLEQLAEDLAISPATLKRRLKAHHTNYRTLLDEVRKQHADFLSKVYAYSDERIALEMKFFDVSNYRRAFKRWLSLHT